MQSITESIQVSTDTWSRFLKRVAAYSVRKNITEEEALLRCIDILDCRRQRRWWNRLSESEKQVIRDARKAGAEKRWAEFRKQKTGEE